MIGRPEPAVSDSHAQPPAADLPQPSDALRTFLASPAGNILLRSLAGYFHATLEGHQHIPRQGPALIVSNHALFALDSVVLGALLIEHVQRFPRFLADRALWKIPGLRGVIRAIGGLPGDPRSADVLLRNGELVVVYPGGVDDSLKHNSQHHRLMWKNRVGFARVAMTARVPIIPVVGLGIDDMYRVIAREHYLGRRIFGSERYDLPLPMGALGTILPRRAPQHYEVLPPIDTSGDPSSEADIEKVRAATYHALETRLRQYRIQRGERD
jgi:1-acyl-sn-glycerol-3-phosphate acyltransferase